MKTPSQDTIVAFHNWNNAFNNRDAEEQIKYMHFPHLRLANDKYQLWDTPDDFRKLQESMTENLMKENWNHISIYSIYCSYTIRRRQSSSSNFTISSRY
jgi:hypothetical protein